MAYTQTAAGKAMPFLDKNKPGYDPKVNAIAMGDIHEEIRASVTVTLTAAQVKALYTTEQTLVAAPGTGKAIIVDAINFKMVFNANAYTGSNALEFRYTDKSGTKVTADIAAATLNASSGTTLNEVKGVVTAIAPVANAPIVVNVPTANPAAGDSPVTFIVRYHVVDFN